MKQIFNLWSARLMADLHQTSEMARVFMICMHKMVQSIGMQALASSSSPALLKLAMNWVQCVNVWNLQAPWSWKEPFSSWDRIVSLNMNCNVMLSIHMHCVMIVMSQLFLNHLQTFSVVSWLNTFSNHCYKLWIEWGKLFAGTGPGTDYTDCNFYIINLRRPMSFEEFFADMVHMGFHTWDIIWGAYFCYLCNPFFLGCWVKAAQ